MLGGSRIVIDTRGPVRIDRAFTAAEGQPARLVLDLAATDRDSFLRNIALRTGRRGRSGSPPSPSSRTAIRGR